MTRPKAHAPLGEAGFRRDAAHALSTPLGSLLLQVELIDHYLRGEQVDKARDAVASLMQDFETFGREFRSVFSAIADIAEDGGGAHADPQACLLDALLDLGAESPRATYEGVSPPVALPVNALTALMRRLVMAAGGMGLRDVALLATCAGDSLQIALTGVGEPPAARARPFDPVVGLHVSVAREIAARFGGGLDDGAQVGTLLRVVLPCAPPGA